LLWRALDGVTPQPRLAWAWILAVAYAATDEFHQSFTAGRHMSVQDVAIDATGAMIGLAALWVFLRVWRSRTAAKP